MNETLPKYHKGMGEAADDILTAENAYWGALLTFNGIVIAIFSAVAVIGNSDKWIIFLLLLVSLTDSILLIANFYTRLAWHYRKALLFQVEPGQLEQATKLFAAEAVVISNNIRKRHPFIIGFLALELILMLGTILSLLLPKCNNVPLLAF